MLNRIVVPDLTGGVSRQPDSQRFPNQVDSADNASFHFSRGLEKRPGSEMMFQRDTITEDVTVHWIERSATQRYFAMFRPHASIPLIIHKLDGTVCTVTYTGSGPEIVATKAYLNTAGTNLRMLSVDDTTIVVNKSVTVAIDTTTNARQYSGTNVDLTANAHNKASWEEFDLPPAVAGENWYARDDALGHSSGWYESLSITTQPWYKRVKTPMANSAFDYTTMPIRIVQTADTTFEVKYCPWVDRLSGDSQTNAGPSFVGKTIADVCIHRNRLWFASGENLIASASGEFYSFWLDSYSSVIDSDPIDIKLSSSQITKVSWMAPFQRSIVIFTESGQQYEVRAAEALTPTTVSIVPSTSYNSPVTRPVIVGSQLYWSTDKGPWAQIFEYITNEQTAHSLATDIASHVDSYLEAGSLEFKASLANDMLFIRNGDNTLYVNYMFWQGEKKLQLAWSKWTFPVTHTILGCHVLDDYLYTVSRVDSGTDKIRLDRTPLRSSDVVPSYRPRFDSINTLAGTWDPTTKTTTFEVLYVAPELNSVYLGSAWGTSEGLRYTPLSVTAGSNKTIVVVSGKLDAFNCTIGSSYEMSIKLSRQYVRDQQGIPAVGALQLKQCTVFHRNTGYFTFVIDTKTEPASERIYKYTGKQLGSIGFITTTNVLSDRDSQHFKIMSSAAGVDLYIKSDSPAPCNITSLEFVADFVPGKRSATSS